MINAKVAKQNVINYDIKRFEKVKMIVDGIIPVISKNIEYNSNHGLSSITLFIYNDIQFCDREIASGIFEKVLKDNGYTIIKNDWKNNSLTFKW